MKSDYASVNDQSGIFAGKGGYDITVGNNTDLKGAVIASEAEDISKNKLDTGTISFSDIKNKANFKVSHISVSGGTGGASAPTAYQNSDKASSTTKSAVEKGQLIVRNKEEQQQDINKLSRDTASANNPLKQIFDKQKELDKIETVELVKDIAQQAKNVVNKYDRIQAQNDVDKNKDKLSKAEAEKAYKSLSDEEKAKYKSVDDYYEQNKASCYYAAVDTQLKANQEKNKNLGTMGGNVSKGIDTATSIVMGIINGDITGGLAGASAPWIAEQIKLHTGHKDEKGEWKVDDPAANYIAHAILGAVVAELQGNSGLAGGAGAVGGEIAADIIRKAIYAGKDVKDLTESEKQNISALTQLAIGLTIASMGGDTGDVATGVNSSKNAVENNFAFLVPVIPAASELIIACFASGPCTIITAAVLSTIMSEVQLEEYKQNGYQVVILDPDKLPKLEGYPIPENNNIPPLITPIHEQDKDAGKLVTPVVEIDKNESIYKGPEIDIGDWRDNVLTSQKPYEPNQGSVGNMGEFLGQPGFGSDVKKNSNKTSRQYQGQSIYTAKKPIGDIIQKGDQFYLDGQHKNHIEVFDKRGNFRAVLNLDGTVNEAKTKAAEGRKLK